MQASGTQAELNASTEVVPNGFVVFETDTGILSGDSILFRWKRGDGSLTYSLLPYEQPSATPGQGCQPTPEPSNPCPECEEEDCDLCEQIAAEIEMTTVVSCIPDELVTEALCLLIQRPQITVEVVLVCADGAGLTAGLIAALCGSCLDGNAELEDTLGGFLSSTPVPAGSSVPIVAPDATRQLKDAAANDIGTPLSFLSGSSGNIVIAGSTVYATDGVTVVAVILATQSHSLVQSVVKYRDAANASQVTAASDTEFASSTLRPAMEVPRREIKNLGGTGMGVYVTVDRLIADTVPNAPIPLKFALAASQDASVSWTVTTDEAGVYGTYTQDGSSGTLEYRKNAGAWTALSGSITLAVSDTIEVRRSVFSAAGWIKWAP